MSRIAGVNMATRGLERLFQEISKGKRGQRGEKRQGWEGVPRRTTGRVGACTASHGLGGAQDGGALESVFLDLIGKSQVLEASPAVIVMMVMVTVTVMVMVIVKLKLKLLVMVC
jgi:hypothetical protein